MIIAIRCLVVAAYVAICLSTVGAQQATPTHTIDLVAAPARPPDGAVDVPLERRLTQEHPEGFISHGPVRRPSPLAVDLISIDRLVYDTEDPFIFEVVLTNVGQTPLRIPVSPDGARVDRDMTGASILALALSFEDELLGHQNVGLQFLYGADDLGGSLITVRPQERVLIRAQGRWLLQTGHKGSLPQQWTRDVRLRAEVKLTGTGKGLGAATSDSSALVEVRRRSRN